MDLAAAGGGNCELTKPGEVDAFWGAPWVLDGSLSIGGSLAKDLEGLL